ncbi:MAG: FAD-dependent oxidoreductase, partial [Nanoarchaeota archaeon]
MAAGTKKIGSAGRYGVRYGATIKQKVVEIEKIDCEFRLLDAIYFTLQAGNLRADFEALKKIEPGLKFLESREASELSKFKVEGALYIKNEAQFHIRKFLLALADIIVKNGGAIFEDTEVLEITRDGKIFLAHGEIQAGKVLITTGIAPVQFPEINKLLTPYFTYVIAADFKDPRPFGDFLFWDDEEPYHYFRWVSPSKIILGGEDRLMKGPRPAASPHENLKKFLEELTGRAAVLTHTGQGSIFMTKDSFP